MELEDDGAADAAADLARLANLNDGDVNRIAEALRRVEPSAMNLDVLRQELAGVFSAGDQPAAHRLASIIWHIYELSVQDDDDVTDIIDGFGAWLQTNDAIEATTWQTARGRLNTLTQIPSVFIAVKAEDLREAVHSEVSSVRVICDLRPIFAARVDDGPVSFALLHSLELTVSSRDEDKPIYVTMSDDVLLELSEQVDRALAKGRALKNLVNDRLGSSCIV